MRIVLIPLLFALACSARAGTETCTPDGLIANRAVIRVAPGRTLDEAVAALEAGLPGLVVTPIDAIESRGMYHLALSLPGGANEHDLELTLFDPGHPATLVGDGSDPQRPLRWGELDYEVETGESKTGSGYVSGPALTLAAADEQYAATTLGVSAAQMRSAGSGVAVAILDTGIASGHAAFADADIAMGYNFVTNSTDTLDLGDGADNDNDGLTDEGVGHGTFVAGLVHQVAPGARLVPVVVLDSEGRAGVFRIAEGIFYAIDRGVEVINMSLGSTYDSTAIEDGLDEARDFGITVVAAAGNCDSDERVFPAMKSHVLGVASLDIDDRKSGFSNFNDKVSLAAPGGSEPDAGDPTGFDPSQSILGPLPDGTLGVWEGTSLATGWVAGTAALVRAQHPEWPPTEFTGDLVENLLAQTAVDVYAVNPQYADDEELGAGRLDTEAAVAAGPPQPMQGDLNNDGAVDLSDLATLLLEYGLTHSAADLDLNGRVDVSDLAILLGRLGTSCPGDFNGDQVVDLADLALVLANFGRTDAGASDGDSDRDGDVDLSDLGLLLSRFGETCG